MNANYHRILTIADIPVVYPKITFSLTAILIFLWEAFHVELSVILMVVFFVILDTGLAVYYAWKKKVISSRKFASLFEKIIIYIILLVVSHLPVVIFDDPLSNIIFSPIQSIIYVSVILRELISILETTANLGIFPLPRKLIEKLEEFKDYTNEKK